MTGDPDDLARATAEQVVELEGELEASGVASLGLTEVEWMRAALHDWVEQSIGFVVSPGLGRVTVLHEGGKRSSIASATLPYLMSKAPAS